jgi:hypothetical protein
MMLFKNLLGVSNDVAINFSLSFSQGFFFFAIKSEKSWGLRSFSKRIDGVKKHGRFSICRSYSSKILRSFSKLIDDVENH